MVELPYLGARIAAKTSPGFPVLIPLLMILTGEAPAGDSVSFFVRGKALFVLPSARGFKKISRQIQMSVSGQIYLAVIIAMLVGKYVGSASSNSEYVRNGILGYETQEYIGGPTGILIFLGSEQ